MATFRHERTESPCVTEEVLSQRLALLLQDLVRMLGDETDL